MIGKLSGKVDSLYEDSFILDVGGVGYLLYCPVKTLSKYSAGDSCSLFVETCVREDNISLYGFSSQEEKLFFNLLRSVSGIGNKTSMSVLSQMDPASIAGAIGAKDKNAFKHISGIGAKTSERIVMELRDKIPSSYSFTQKAGTANYSIESDAVNALIGLGISRIEAYNKVGAALANNPGLSIEELVKTALRN